MKRVLIFSAVAAAAVGLSAAPAVAGLAGNASFSHQLPVRVPSGATAAQVADDHGHEAVDNDSDTNSATPTATPTSASPTATRTDRDEHHGSPTPSTTTEPGEDRHGSPTGTEPGDDRGQDATTSASDEKHRGRDGSGRGDGGSDG